MSLPLFSPPCSCAHPARRRRPSGAALVIVLAFVVLLTGLVVAFFSRAMSERQISNSSASQTRVDLFAQGTVDTILGDLKQEIALNSHAMVVTGGTLQVPNSAATMLPALAGSTGANGLENLVKVSGTAPPYPGGTTRASSASTTGTSLNGRFFSAARWNKALLMPMTSATNGTFTPPHWILVARDGSNPTAWNSNMAASGSNATTVVGRYAYAIYDEGGLLDVNVAGYPSITSADRSSCKPALAYADLTQVGLTSTQSNKLVAWRNWASSQAPGATFSSPGFTAASGTSYFNSVIANTTGFLKTSAPALNNGQTDRMFTSRQELIHFLQDGLGLSTTNPAFQYLTHFSRDLCQPSLAPASTYDATAPKLLKERTDVSTDGLSGTSGGNNAFPYNASIGGDDPSLATSSGDGRINPLFLAVRVQSPFTRNDGSRASVGEPLAKKRFNLNRLAWLTYNGPSGPGVANPGGRNPADADMAAQLASGIPAQWLAQGTDDNIKKYFGLTWNSGSNCWVYDHGITNGSGDPIVGTLASVAALTGSNAREPDFFELLKASINAGALGKASFVNIDLADATHPLASAYPNYAFQYSADVSVDYQILQIGANIIDQYDADGYPTLIHWENPGTTTDFAGVENLPYLNRLRTMVIKAILPSPLSYTPGNTIYKSTTNAVANTGLGVVLWYPEVWNPHDWNSSNPNQTLGTPAPSNFQICAETDNYILNSWCKYNYNDANKDKILVSGSVSTADINKSPGYYTNYMKSPPLPLEKLTQANSAMTFSVTQDATGAALFREPTLLFRPNMPTGSSLAAPGLPTALAADLNTSAISRIQGGNGGIKKDPALPSDPILADAPGQEFIGFYVGAAPLRYAQTSGSTTYVVIPSQLSFVNPLTNESTSCGPSPRVTLRFMNAAGQWVVYDSKYSDCPGLNNSIMGGGTNGFFSPSPDFMTCALAFEPRTSRFGMIFNCSKSYNSTFPPADKLPSGWAGNSTYGWVNQAEGIVVSNRPDVHGGSGILPAFPNWSVKPSSSDIYFPFSSCIGWFPGSSGSSSWLSGVFRPGLFAQNNPAVSDDGLFIQGANPAATTGTNYYADADGVVRRGSAAWVVSSGTSATSVGLPQALASGTNASSLTRNAAQSASRPMILNRPFRSVADLGYVFSGTPFKNLDFFTPESGYAGLLDVFCLNDTDDPNSLTAGRVNLNTRQAPVLQAILAGAYRDEWNAAGTTLPGGAGSLAANIARALVARTQSAATGKGPLRNVSELVGKWVSRNDVSGDPAKGINGPASYDGFSADLSSVLASGADTNIQRFREASMRALANCGQTRVWNLMIDVVAQTGRYPRSATSLDHFNVEGEQRYWVHVAIDRLTGQVIDRQIEVVKE